MSESNPIFSYTKRDYEGSRQEGIAKIPILSKGAWTDLNATDPGIIIMDYVHALVDMINFYQDHQALESFITTAKERKNIFRLAKQLSYKVRSAKGATTEVTFTSREVYEYSIKIDRHTTVSTPEGITYLTDKVAYLAPGETSVIIPCTQGSSYIMEYTGTGVSRFSSVENAENQSITLTTPNIDIDTILIKDNSGRTWSAIDYIVFSTSTDRVYQVDLNPDDTVTIKFGDGERGVVPKETDKLIIEYVANDAENGKVGANTLTVLNDSIYDKYGHLVDFIVYNLHSSVGGSTSQSSSEITELAPGAIKAQNRAVTLSDFENLAKLVDGVADAKAYDINVAPDICLFHEVKVVIIPKIGEDSLESLRNNVYKYLYQRMIPPTNLQVLTPSKVLVDIKVVVKQIDQNVEGGLDYQIREVVQNYFNNRSNAIGEDFYPSDLMQEIASIGEVRYIVSMSPTNPVSIQKLSVASLGNLTIEIQ